MAGASATRPLLEIEGLRTVFGAGAREIRIVDDASLKVGRGQTTQAVGQGFPRGEGAQARARAVAGAVVLEVAQLVERGQQAAEGGVGQAQGGAQLDEGATGGGGVDQLQQLQAAAQGAWGGGHDSVTLSQIW